MVSTQKLVACAKSILETLEKGLKYLFAGKTVILQNEGKFSVSSDILQSWGHSSIHRWFGRSYFGLVCISFNERKSIFHYAWNFWSCCSNTFLIKFYFALKCKLSFYTPEILVNCRAEVLRCFLFLFQLAIDFPLIYLKISPSQTKYHSTEIKAFKNLAKT